MWWLSLWLFPVSTSLCFWCVWKEKSVVYSKMKSCTGSWRRWVSWLSLSHWRSSFKIIMTGNWLSGKHCSRCLRCILPAVLLRMIIICGLLSRGYCCSLRCFREGVRVLPVEVSRICGCWLWHVPSGMSSNICSTRMPCFPYVSISRRCLLLS